MSGARPGGGDHDPSLYAIDKAWMRRSFDQASATYDTAAVLQRDVQNQLLARLDLVALSPRLVLDVGAGTGHGVRALKRRYPRSQVVALDSSLGMLKAAARRQSWLRGFARVCADAECLPFADGTVDLIVSNFMLPWSDLDTALAEFRRVLAPRGCVSFTTLGPDTLRELRRAWSTAGAAGAPPRVSQFIDMHDVGDALLRAGLTAPVLDVEVYTLQYLDVGDLTADLQALGTRNGTRGRLRGLTGPRRWRAMHAAYERERTGGRLPATYEVVFGQAWGPVSAPRHANPDSVEVSLDDIKRQLRARRG
ncbi:MAG: malonyl-ACP O-methyltransferase BioC [Steroidobacteraceae bacterium]